jgi:D-beta-D-heptose 7-phosphate kinase/D-beta-D-heptose 1-phosphate adenosyltransferase
MDFGENVEEQPINSIYTSWRDPSFVALWPRDNVAFVNGILDLLHVGHLAILEAAKREDDTLVVVALNSDASTKRLKGKNRPYVSLGDRLMMVSAIRYVDIVVGFDENTPEDLLRLIRPRWLIKGEEYRNQPIAGSQYASDIIYVPMVPFGHTTDLVLKIRKTT